MPSPFPGMDPFLEKSSRWPNVHHGLISEIQAQLNRELGPRYYAEIQERVYISTGDDPGRSILIPDVHITSRSTGHRPPMPAVPGGGEIAEPLVLETLTHEEIRQPYVEIIHVDNRKVITVIEVLSPDNKSARARGLKSFRQKRDTVMRSRSHWVEIDLLRRGVSLALRKRIRPHEYFVHISPVELRPEGRVWPIRLSQRLPVIPIPLQSRDDDSPLNLQAVLDSAYDRARYDRVIDYTKEPDPPLSKEWRDWADRLLREKGLRPDAAPG
jgi:hypothetical protein